MPANQLQHSPEDFARNHFYLYNQKGIWNFLKIHVKYQFPTTNYRTHCFQTKKPSRHNSQGLQQSLYIANGTKLPFSSSNDDVTRICLFLYGFVNLVDIIQQHGYV